ncbi:3D-(3,5/4)-trihydroxycyclohexane-1,2-dione acylhydrolase (decyclizing) [Bartonella sp. HY329]|uniref:3D-(3,5/4)-trihydroxycyclohexane-1,2-dione acylhydrolase (decyclizing) n=1 Tax=unclassified Bartonella TaxID=2645622 RepID=UPI0021C7F4C9|nr:MULTISPECIES: 3D-(3,5/4)-trihydroxycyclohexane-1,2-dione acylhydrolase (decyclizing) [unclassified Bartonella]UXM94407.1 3D-(3,5/4)-trihydroxycyclohexane-1,2-dione acylhydrolase (decyclizing) [Bartonella sp. HY329]UXN08730.1 3D-(3,5/4)-trihydroxycyclohexane-1,2-dione acylhydrolase (decyclizing) [Bartonella sp. HY328]
MKTVRLTMAQALVRYLCNQFTEVDGERVPLFPGVFGIFGHGNVTCLAEALEEVQDILPTWRGQNEQSMALAAIGFAKAKKRRQIMVATSSIGPGALNMVTAAGVAHTNRLPILLLAGDTFANRRPDPVMQQVEHYGNPTTTVNDAFKAVVRYWDRITHPEQIISSMQQAVATMLDPADCGPAFIALPQDVQELAWDYPETFFESKTHLIGRARADRVQLEQAISLIKSAKKPLIIAGGGVRYSGAEKILAQFALDHNIPLCETIAGKSSVIHNHPAHIGPIGIVGSTSANKLAAEADLIIAVGTRLMDYTTGSWTVFKEDAKIVAINAARFDAKKHLAHAVIGDALAIMEDLTPALADYKADASWMEEGRQQFAQWNAALDEYQKPSNTTAPTYAQVIGVINEKADERDLVITAAGGFPGEAVKNWRVKSEHSFDCEFGFSCMGYEIPAGWGAAMADPSRTPIVMIGDGTYMMMNSDIYSTILTGHKIILLVCDNGGYAVINRLQNAKGGASFNNLIKDCNIVDQVYVDFAQHAQSMGALTRRVESLTDLAAAMDWAKTTDRTTVITMTTDAFTWTPGDTWWDVGVPEVSNRPEVNEVYQEQVKVRQTKQRVGV